jgi:hypothetical protein
LIGKSDDVLVEGAVVVEFPVLADEGGASLVEHPRQQGVAAQADAHAAGRALGEIGWGDVVFHGLKVFVG